MGSLIPSPPGAAACPPRRRQSVRLIVEGDGRLKGTDIDWMVMVLDTPSPANDLMAVAIGEDAKEIEETLAAVEDKALIPVDHSKIWVAEGCEKCNKTGFKGRTGLYEAILMNASVEKAVSVNGSDREIWEAAKGEGGLTMKQDGSIKVLGGITSMDELRRVIALEN